MPEFATTDLLKNIGHHLENLTKSLEQKPQYERNKEKGGRGR